MSSSSFPHDLQELERRIAERLEHARDHEPDSAFRSRILGGVRAELRDERARDRRAFAVAVAAVLLVLANLSSSAALVTDCEPRLADGRPSVAETTDRIRELVPGLTETEALHHARRLSLESGIDPDLPLVSFSRRRP